MPIETADDFASFFAADEFGEAITLDGVGGLTALWDRPSDEARFGGGRQVLDTNTFRIPAALKPEQGSLIVVDRTGDEFKVHGDPKLSVPDGAWWVCSAIPT